MKMVRVEEETMKMVRAEEATMNNTEQVEVRGGGV